MMSHRRLLTHAMLLDPEAEAPQAGSLLVENGRITGRFAPGASVDDAEIVDLHGRYLAPGFIDLHYHGDLVFRDLASLPEALAACATRLAADGVTAYLPTTVSWPQPRLAATVARLVAGVADLPQGGAVALGLHLEGPWIAPAARGAQPEDGVRPYDPREGAEVLAAADGQVRMVTLAPECPGSALLLEELVRRGIVAALGHSRATTAEAAAATERGARHVTHLWNAMAGLHHREPGLIGHVLGHATMTADLIADGIHVDRRVVALSARLLGPRLVAITDRMHAPDGSTLDFGAGPVIDDGRALFLADGRLAGSTLTMARAVANLQSYADTTLIAAIAAATLAPARVLGLTPERGTLRPGARADLVVLTRDLSVAGTYIGGTLVHTTPGVPA